jgi:hypothetical protein
MNGFTCIHNSFFKKKVTPVLLCQGVFSWGDCGYIGGFEKRKKTEWDFKIYKMADQVTLSILKMSYENKAQI